MPTETFFRLPMKKREKLLHAIRTEFTRVPFSEISINRIVQKAEIPRGSFYQYFSDKEDLLDYLLLLCHERMLCYLQELLDIHRGNLLSAALATYDRIEVCNGANDQAFLQQLLGNLRLRDHRFSAYLRTLDDITCENILQQISPASSPLRTRESFELATDLMETAICSAIAERFSTETPPAAIRERLEKKLKLILCGFAQTKENSDAC